MAFDRSRARLALDMPWAAAYELRRLAAQPFIRLMFALHGIAWGRRWRIWGMPVIQRYRGSRIALGDGLQLRSWAATNPLIPNHPFVLATRSAQATITVGREAAMTGVTIVAADCIAIGDRVMIGANVTIVDTDFHPLDPLLRQEVEAVGEARAVFVEDDVFIGMQSIVLKGVRLGAGCVIGAGSVVTHDAPAGALVAGNPARFVRWLERNRE